MAEKKKKFKYLEVTWVDADEDPGWHGWSKLKESKIHPCTSVGILVKEDEHFLYLSTAVSHNEFCSPFRIPKTWIKRRRVIGGTSLIIAD